MIQHSFEEILQSAGGTGGYLLNSGKKIEVFNGRELGAAGYSITC